MNTEQLGAVRRALDLAPCSDRALALKAGVPPSTISRIRKGERGVTPEVATRIAAAIGEWAADCQEAEAMIRRALEQERSG
jgi:transcriptional regulator with XRE-family HTH domain